MDRLDFGRIIREMAVGFALHEMIFDAEGRPVDYRFLDANPAYERITGLRVAEILGKTVREALPSVETRWIETYGRVVQTGEPASFTDYAEALHKHFEIWAYRPAPGLFIVLVQDASPKVEAERAALRQAAILRAVLGSIDISVAFKDTEGRYLGCNSTYERTFGVSEEELVGEVDDDLFEPEEAARIKAEDREILGTGLPMKPERSWRKNSTGRERLFERSKRPLLDDSGTPFGIAVFWHDISDEALAVKADAIHIALARVEDSSSSAELLRRALDELEAATGSSLGFFTCLDDAFSAGEIDVLSTRTLGELKGHADGLGHRPFDETGPWRGFASTNRPLILEGGDFPDTPLPPGHPALRRALLVPVLREGAVVGMLGVANKDRPYNDWDLALASDVADLVWEIYERKEAQESSRRLALQRDFAISAMRAGVETWYLDEDRKVYDRNWAGILGYALEELPSDARQIFRLLCHPEDYEAASAKMKAYLEGRSDSYEAEFRMLRKDGRWIWVLDRGQVVERGSSGQPMVMSGLMVDVNGLKLAEERLKVSLGEKEILLQELFHRTRNTMQLINAMLELKKQGLESPAFAQAIETVQGKIIAMSLVQEKLYRGSDLSVLDLGEYIAELVELIKQGAPNLRDNVRINSETMAVPVSVDAAIPCGLIISELVSNALVHAFPGGAPGSIDVSVSRDLDEISIGVSDDGVGLPAGYDLRSGPNLGLKTVLGIGEEQLHGRVEFRRPSKGFSCRLTFKDSYYTRRL
jgi:PAS domain S-box-containing protein